MNRSRWPTFFLVLGIGCGLILLMLFLRPILLRRPSGIIAPTPTLLLRVQGLAQLTTVKFVLEKVVILEDVKWYGENRLLMVANGQVKAGVDLSQLKSDHISVQGKTVVVTLPPAQITDVYLNEKETKVIERTTGILRSFDKDLEQNGRRQAIEDLRRAAFYGGILKEADERARAQIKNLFELMGYTEIEFRDSSSSLLENPLR